jgi:hypothetical protein
MSRRSSSRRTTTVTTPSRSRCWENPASTEPGALHNLLGLARPKIGAESTVPTGSDTGSSVSVDYTPDDSHFTGTVNWVQLDAGDDDHDHLISPEERRHVAMARQ